MRARSLCSLHLFLATFVVMSICEGGAWAATEKILHSFNGTLVHGSTPESALISDSGGNLYGTSTFGGAYSQGTVFRLTPNSKGGWTQTVLYSFKGAGDGAGPTASLIFDALGNLYGTTAYGGIGSCTSGGLLSGCGTVFKLSPSSSGGWIESVLYLFQGGSDGAVPFASLVFDSAGNLYGTTVSGGTTGRAYGTIFKLTQSSGGGWTESILHTFTGLSDGGSPGAALVFDASGNLYGTAGKGGSLGGGVVFELTPGNQGTWTENVLYNFVGGTDGSGPSSPLIFDSAGNLYGTTHSGGSTSNCGTVFELKPNGNSSWSESVLHSFGSTTGDGAYPVSGLTFDQSGNLYGTTVNGGGTNCYDANNNGIVFQLTPSSNGQWTENILHTFSTGYFTGNPYGGLLLLGGSLYGTSGYGGSANLGTVFKFSQKASGNWTQETIYWFPGNDGAEPLAGLVADSAGNLYGTTGTGGLYNNGAVFKLSPNLQRGWTYSVIYSFRGAPDGAGPFGGLTFDDVGNLYGTTFGGGTGICVSSPCGTVFELTPSTSGKWTETVLHSFAGGADGQYPYVGVVFSHGSLLGTTSGGGGNGSGCAPDIGGCGVVFELTPSSGGMWTETIIHTFTGGSDGADPGDGLLSPDASGNLYGSTIYTGCDACLDVFPTVFELSPNGTGGWTFNTIYTFTDFGTPVAGFVFDSLGNMYGTTNWNASYFGYSCGTVSRLTDSGGTWSRSVIHVFFGGSNGCAPGGGVTFDTAGNLYGTSGLGGKKSCNTSGSGCGIVFELAPETGHSWELSVLHAFSGGPSDGAAPQAAVIIDAAGNVYSTTSSGGAYGYGAVFEVTP